MQISASDCVAEVTKIKQNKIEDKLQSWLHYGSQNIRTKMLLQSGPIWIAQSVRRVLHCGQTAQDRLPVCKHVEWEYVIDITIAIILHQPPPSRPNLTLH